MQLNPADTTVETVYVYCIVRDGELRVETDWHTTGLFPLATWERLLGESGLDVERVDYPVGEDGKGMYLWVCTLRAG